MDCWPSTSGSYMETGSLLYGCSSIKYFTETLCLLCTFFGKGFFIRAVYMCMHCRLDATASVAINHTVLIDCRSRAWFVIDMDASSFYALKLNTLLNKTPKNR